MIHQKHGGKGVGLIFPVCQYRKFKKKSCEKPLDGCQYNLAQMFLPCSSAKIVQACVIRQKTWLPGGRAYFPYMSI